MTLSSGVQIYLLFVYTLGWLYYTQKVLDVLNRPDFWQSTTPEARRNWTRLDEPWLSLSWVALAMLVALAWPVIPLYDYLRRPRTPR